MKQTQKFETLLKQSTAVGGAAFAGVFVAGAASAGTTDLLSTLEITDINVTLEAGEKFKFDLNDDGLDDFSFDVEAIRVKKKKKFGLDERVDLEENDGPVMEEVTPERATIISFASGNRILVNTELDRVPFATALSEGDYVDGKPESGSFRGGGALIYDTRLSSEGQTLPEEGATAYIGLALGFDDFRETRLVDVDEDEEFAVPSFGWIEVERGSLTILRAGFQTVAGLAAPIPAVSTVPVPATLPLLLTGALGLTALRRRKKAA